MVKRALWIEPILRGELGERMKYIIAYDLGTGGIKTSLFDARGERLVSCFTPCDTTYPAPDFREQRPEDWWRMLRQTTKELLRSVAIDANDIVALACSGHSLGVVPIDAEGRLLRDAVPIWSDARATREAAVRPSPSAAPKVSADPICGETPQRPPRVRVRTGLP